MVRHTLFLVGSALADPPEAAAGHLPAGAGAAPAPAATPAAAAVAAPAATASGGARS